MDDRENERLGRLEVRVNQLSKALFDTQDQLIEERSRHAALKLILLTVVGTMILNNTLELSEVLNDLAEVEGQVDPTNPDCAALAHEVQEVRSELGQLLAPAQATLSHGVLATLQRGSRKRERLTNAKRTTSRA